MKHVEYARDAAKMLQRMDRVTALRIRSKVRQYADDPASLANNVIVTNGDEGLRRMRVGDWRVIFTEDMVVVLVIRVAPRGGAYD
jgi:mRNA interferase RelE/StbE